jgi:channel protein (hemolysin III family)
MPNLKDILTPNQEKMNCTIPWYDVLYIHYTLCKGLDSFLEHKMVSLVEPMQDQPRWPIYVYLCTTLYLLVASTLYHWFSICGIKSFTILRRCDYSGISILIAGSFIGVLYYLMELGVWRFVYMGFIVAACGIMVVFTFFEKFHLPKYRRSRVYMYIVIGLLGVIPLLHLKYKVEVLQPVHFHSLALLLAMAISYIGGALFYMVHFPEIYSPGRFDIWVTHSLFFLLYLSLHD